MKDVIGIVLLIAAGAFFYLAIVHRRRVLAERRQALARGESAEPPRLHPSLEFIAEVVPSMMIMLLTVLAASIVVAFFALRATQTFSLFDLAAFLLALVGYGAWFVVKTRYRALSTQAQTYDQRPRLLA